MFCQLCCIDCSYTSRCNIHTQDLHISSGMICTTTPYTCQSIIILVYTNPYFYLTFVSKIMCNNSNKKNPTYVPNVLCMFQEWHVMIRNDIYFGGVRVTHLIYFLCCVFLFFCFFLFRFLCPMLLVYSELSILSCSFGFL
jgi:hypothetical protein